MTRPDTSNTNLSMGGGSVTENESPQTVTIYPKNYVTTTSCGHTIELDNSEDGERIRVIHGKTGNVVEMNEEGDTLIQCKKNLNLNSEETTTLKVGKDPKKDKLLIEVVGDCHLGVEGDLHTEVFGDRYDMVHGLWQQTAKGALMIKGSDDIGIQSDSELRMIANSVNTTATFTNTNIKKGGQVVEEIHGNRVIRMSKEGGTFAIESEGDLRFNVKGCRYDNIGRNYFTEVQGKIKIKAVGDDIDCLQGGAPDGMNVSKPGDSPYGTPTGWELSTGSTSVAIKTEDFYMAANGAAKMTAGGDEFKIECDNGIYLN